MTRLRPTRRLAVVGVVVLGLFAGVAFAFFSSTGAGSASASVGTLSAPTITTATPGAGTVSLSWSTVTPPGTGSVSYYVKRNGGAPAGNCPTSSSPTGVTSCTDSGLVAGSYSYTVTAVWRTWTATSTTTNVTVGSGAATHLVLAAATTTPTAGATDNLTITAKDAANNTVTSYTGDKSLTFSGAANAPDGTHPTVSDKTGTATNFGVPTTITFSGGVASVLGANNGVMRLYKAETANVAVTDGSIGDPGLSVMVSPAAAATLAVAGYPSPTVAGVAHSFTVTARDAFGNTATGYSGTVGFSSSDAAAVLPANSTLTAGTGTFSATFKTVAGGTKTLTATDTGTSSITGSQSGITVTPAAAATLLVAGYPSSTVAGVSNSFTVTARDAFGNTATGYSGTVGFAATGDAAAVLPANSTLTAGTGTFSATFKTVAGGTKTLTATDTGTSSITGSQSGITVTPAAAATLLVAGYPSSTVAGVSNSFTVTARDAFGNTATGYGGTVAFSATGDSAAVLPANSSLIAGTGTFSATFKTVAGGTKTLTATDTVTSSITGSQTGITVTPAGASSISVVSGSGQSTTVNTAFANPLVALVTDSFSNPISGASVTFAAPTTGASGIFGATGCTSNSPVTTCVATTASNGRATSSTFTANAITGTYNVAASAPGAGSVNFAMTNVGVDTFQVTVAGTPLTAGTSTSITLTAMSGASTDTSYQGVKCVTFTGASASSPNATASTFPAQGACAAGQSSLTFSNGTVTFSATLTRAASSTTLTATEGVVTGTSAAFAVNSAGVALSYSQACGTTAFPKNATATSVTLNVPSDTLGNPFTRNATMSVGLTLSPTTNFGFGNAAGNATTTVSVQSGPTGNSFNVTTTGGPGKSTTITMGSLPAGFTAPTAPCTWTTGP